MRKRKIIPFIIAVILIFGFITLLYTFVSSFWYGYVLLGLVVTGLILLRFFMRWRRITSIVCWVLSISIVIVGMVYIRPETNVSTISVLTRESIRTIVQMPKLREEGLFNTGSSFSEKKSLWKAPKGYMLEKHDIDGLPLELLIDNSGNPENVILHLHGGAYVIGYMDVYRVVALRYSKLSGGASVASIDYRIAPEHQFPAALIDAEKAWEWLLSEGYREENIIVVGDSAGGNLALALVAKLRDEGRPLPKAMVLMSPWTDLAGEGDSYTTNIYKDPIFGRKEGVVYNPSGKINNPYVGDADLKEPYLSPAYGEFHQFPPMLIQVGTYEILESDSITIYNKSITEGVQATLTRYEGMFHAFQLAGNLLPESKQAWKEVGSFLKLYYN